MAAKEKKSKSTIKIEKLGGKKLAPRVFKEVSAQKKQWSCPGDCKKLTVSSKTPEYLVVVF